MTNSAGRGWPLQTWWTGNLRGFHTKRLNQAEEDIQRMIGDFQAKYKQKEILCYRYHVTRYIL